MQQILFSVYIPGISDLGLIHIPNANPNIVHDYNTNLRLMLMLAAYLSGRTVVIEKLHDVGKRRR